jgi:hypothetical protein
MPEGKLIECRRCGGRLKETFKMLDLNEFEFEMCGRIFTLYIVIKEWPDGTKPARRRDMA